MVKALHIEPSDCTGCHQCEMACSYHHEGVFNPSKSRIKVFAFQDEGRNVPYTCTQCDDAWCMRACPVDAISVNKITAAKEVSEELCVGCKVCTGNGSRIPNADHCPELPKPPANETLEPMYRTTNQHTAPGSKADFWRFNPWRAPGQAPVYDPCGMAGGSTTHRFNAGEYNTTIYAKQGDLGSRVLKPRPSGTVWKKNSVSALRGRLGL